MAAGPKGSQGIKHGRRKRRRMTVSWCKKSTTSSAQTEGEVGQEDRAQKAKKEGMADNLRKQKKLDNAQQVYEEAVEVLQKVMMCGP